VGDEPEKTPRGGEESHEEGSADAEEEQDRPTVAPPFDPIAFAQEVLGGKPSPAKGTPAVTRGETPTLTDPAELEAARRRSLGGSGPASGSGAGHPTAAPGPSSRKPTPTGALSLANARIPSNLPPRKESSRAFGPVEREWEELSTRPPPPMQQELIDATMAGPLSGAREEPPSTKDASELAAARAAEGQGPATPSDDDDAPEIEIVPSEQEMADRVSLGDYTGALDIAEKLLLLDPDNTEAEECAESCRGILRQMYTARIGQLDRVPLVMVPRDQLRWLSIDHRAGFVLSLVDGVSSLEMILDVSGMPELDALRILSELVQQRIISFR
jgi:hypothetical protein